MFSILSRPIGLTRTFRCSRQVYEPDVPEQEWQSFFPPYRPRKKRKVDQITEIDDESILLELAWSARDVAAPDCPRSRKELRRRLGFDESNRSQHVGKSKKLSVEGIGEMDVSGESGGAVLSSSSTESSSTESSSSESSSNNEEPESGVQTVEDDTISKEPMEIFPVVRKIPKKKKLSAMQAYHLARKWDRVPPTSDILITPQFRRNIDIKPKILRKKMDFNRRIVHESHAYMHIYSPYSYVEDVLQHLVQQLLMAKQFRDAVQVMSLFLIQAYRPQRHDISVQFVRFVIQFCRAIPEFSYSDLHLRLLKSCFGFPLILVFGTTGEQLGLNIEGFNLEIHS